MYKTLILTLLFSLSPCLAAETGNYYFDADGYYRFSTEAYADAVPPPDALRIAPPEAVPGKRAKVNAAGDGWVMVEDYFGRDLWHNGQQQRVDYHGPLRSGWSTAAPEPEPPTLEEAKTGKKPLSTPMPTKSNCATVCFTQANVSP